MSLNVGTLQANLELNVGDFDSAVRQARTGLEDVARAAEGVDKKKIAPKVDTGQVEKASKSASELGKSLDDAGKSSGKITAPTAATRGLSDAAKSAQDLSKGLDGAASSAGKVTMPKNVSSEASSASGAVQKLESGFREAAAAGRDLGSTKVIPEGLDQGAGLTSTLAGEFKGLVPAIGAATAAGAVFTKGFGRLESIDSAQGKLRGLGHDVSSVANIMDSANASVTGTAYGLGEAVTTASNAVASGVTPGKELTGVLTTIADTSAIAGSDMSEMGQIFNSVLARGKLQGDDLMQLMSRGIPVLQMLADHLGITAEEASEMATEGAISFEIFEAAMSKSMGGAAQAMGNTFSGAVSNAGAAVGRLGAALLNPGFEAAPNLLSGFTETVNMATKGATALGEAWESVPAPLQQAALAVGAMKVGQMALNSEVGQKFTAALANSGGGVKKWGAGLANAYTQASSPLRALAAGHRESAQSADLASRASTDFFSAVDHTGRQAGHSFMATTQSMLGHAKGMAGGLKFAVSSVVDALGGPLNLALAGAGLAITAYVQASNAAKQAQEEVAAAALDSAAAQDELYEAVKGTTGALDEQGLTAAARVAGNELVKLTSVGGAQRGWLGDMALGLEGVDQWLAKTVFRFNESAQELADNQTQAAGLADQYKAVEKAAEQVGMPMESLNDVVAEGGPVFNELINSLRATGEAADSAAADSLQRARDEIVEITRAAQEVDPAMVSASEAIDMIADSAGDADSMLSGMVKALQVMGLMPKDAEEDLMSLGEAIRDVADAAAEVADWEDGALGEGLFKDDGTLDHMNANAAELAEHMSKLGGEFRDAAASGNDMDQAFEDMQPALDSLQKRFQLTDDQMKSLREQFSLMPGVVSTLYELDGADGAVKDLGDIWVAMYELEEGATIDVGVLSDGAVAMLESLGYKVEELDNGNYEVTVGTAESYNNLGDLIEQAGALDGILYKVTGKNQITVQADQVTDETRAKLEEMHADISSENMHGEVKIDFQNGDQIMQVLQEIGVSLVNLDGELRVDTADVDAAQRRLEALGVASKIEDGVIKIDSNDPAVRQRLVELGVLVADPKTGEVVISDNVPEVDDLINMLRSNAEAGAGGHVEISDNTGAVNANVDAARTNTERGARGDHRITDNSGDVAARVNRNLQGKITYGEHRVNTRFTSGFQGAGGSASWANGGVVDYYADGGMRENRVAQIAKAGAWRVWAEDETGGEAYIPLAESKRARSEAILSEVAKRFGKTIIDQDAIAFADGGISEKVKGDLAHVNGTPYVFGGWGPGGTDCSGAVSMGVNSALGLDPYDSRTATMSMGPWLENKGFIRGQGGEGSIRVAYLNGGPGGGHTAMQLPDGTYIESGGNTGGGLTIGGPAGPLEGRGFTDWYYLPMEEGDMPEFATGMGESFDTATGGAGGGRRPASSYGTSGGGSGGGGGGVSTTVNGGAGPLVQDGSVLELAAAMYAHKTGQPMPDDVVSWGNVMGYGTHYETDDAERELRHNERELRALKRDREGTERDIEQAKADLKKMLDELDAGGKETGSGKNKKFEPYTPEEVAERKRKALDQGDKILDLEDSLEDYGDKHAELIASQEKLRVAVERAADGPTSFGETLGVTAMATGGILGGARNAQIRDSSAVLWAEAGPEAYIPLSNKRDPNSLAIWAETGKRLGVDAISAFNMIASGLPGLAEGRLDFNTGTSASAEAMGLNMDAARYRTRSAAHQQSQAVGAVFNAPVTVNDPQRFIQQQLNSSGNQLNMAMKGLMIK